MAGYLERLSRPGVAVCVLATLLVVGCLGPGESELLEISGPAVPATVGSDPSVTVATVAPETSSVVSVPASSLTPSVDERLVATVTSDGLVERGVQVQVGPPPVPPTSSLPAGVPGECATWRPWVERYGMPWSWAEPIIRRESNCSHAVADRPSTGDLSVGAFQVNFYSRSMAAWWTENGWPFDLLLASPEAAVAAAGALYAACGSGPWDRRAGYPCRGDGRLRTPAEMGYGS